MLYLPKTVIPRTTNNHKALPPIAFFGIHGIGQTPEPYIRTLGANPQLFLRKADQINCCKIVYRYDINAPPKRCLPQLVFASGVGLRTWSTAMTWYMDGNFAMARKEFKQIFVRVVLGQVPVSASYALLPSKRSTAYREMLRTLRTECMGQKGILKAFNTIFGGQVSMWMSYVYGQFFLHLDWFRIQIKQMWSNLLILKFIVFHWRLQSQIGIDVYLRRNVWGTVKLYNNDLISLIQVAVDFGTPISSPI